jgi:hypothetical protein
MRQIVRFAALVAAFMLSREQARYFDCNKLMVASVISGTVTLLLVYACGEVLYRVAVSDLSRDEKLVAALKIALVGGAVVALMGFVTVMTHLCP